MLRTGWWLAVLLLLGCRADRAASTPDAKSGCESCYIPGSPRDIDLLFVVDNSNLAIPELQQNLIRAFPQQCD